jgi:hypothetical protein
MSLPTRPLTLRPIIGAFAFFCRAGDTIDSITVAPETVVSPAAGKPDASPLANWLTLGTVKEATPTVQERSFPYLEPLASGGHIQREQRQVVADYWTIALEGITDIALELLWGIGKITLGTAQVPGTILDRKIEGWLKIQKRLDDGDFCLADQWVEARLTELPKLGTEPWTCQIRFQRLPSTLNTVNFPA